MSLGTGALKVSGVPKPEAARRYPWQPWKAGTTHCTSANPHCHTERSSVETTYLKNTYLDQEQKRGGRRGFKNPQ